jgi:hypothetical protein
MNFATNLNFIVIAHLTAGSSRYVCAPTSRYTDGKALASGDLKLRQRRHLATGFGSSDDADDWVNDAHNKPEYMRAKGVSFFSVAFRKPR